MNKFWTEKYPEGVAKDLPYIDQSLNDFFDEVLTKFAPRKFMTNMGVSYTYQQVDQIATSIAAWMQSLGLPAGSSVGVMMPNVN